MSETTALGAAMAAAVGSGILDKDEIRYSENITIQYIDVFHILFSVNFQKFALNIYPSNLSPVERFDPVLSENDVSRRMHMWHCAVEKSLNSV